MSDILNVLAIVGVSGSGKSMLEANLIAEYREFYKLRQFTTRPPRPTETQGKEYFFVSEPEFLAMKDSLTGKVGFISSNETLSYGSLYGSLPVRHKNKIATIILNEEGLTDLRNDITNGKMGRVNLKVLGLDVDTETVLRTAKRENRSDVFIERERVVLESAHYVYRITDGRYLQPNTLVDIFEVSNWFEGIEFSTN